MMEIIARVASVTLSDLFDIVLSTPLWKLLTELVGLAAALIISFFPLHHSLTVVIMAAIVLTLILGALGPPGWN
jgi:hypothetical protein